MKLGVHRQAKCSPCGCCCCCALSLPILLTIHNSVEQICTTQSDVRFFHRAIGAAHVLFGETSLAIMSFRFHSWLIWRDQGDDLRTWSLLTWGYIYIDTILFYKLLFIISSPPSNSLIFFTPSPRMIFHESKFLPARASSLCPFHLHAPHILATNHDDASLLGEWMAGHHWALLEVGTEILFRIKCFETFLTTIDVHNVNVIVDIECNWPTSVNTYTWELLYENSTS